MQQIIHSIKEFTNNKNDSEKLQLLRNITDILCQSNVKYDELNEETLEFKQESDEVATEYPLSDSDYSLAPIETPTEISFKRKRKLPSLNDGDVIKRRKISFHHKHKQEMKNIDDMNPNEVQSLIHNFEQQIKSDNNIPGLQDKDFHVIDESDTRWNIHHGKLMRNNTLTELSLQEKEMKMVEELEIMEEVLKIEKKYNMLDK